MTNTMDNSTIEDNGTIGNSKCECIHRFDKHYLMLGLNKLIENEDEQIIHVQTNKDKIIKSGVDPDKLIDIHKNLKVDIKSTKARLYNTPICK